MSSLSNDEIILLDILIYLEWKAKEDEKLVNVIDNLLNEKELKYLIDSMSNCIVKMKINEWIKVLTEAKKNLNYVNLKLKMLKVIKTE